MLFMGLFGNDESIPVNSRQGYEAVSFVLSWFLNWDLELRG